MAHILLVEDNEMNRNLISRYLQMFGHEVLAAADGRDGLQQAFANCERLDVVLMDMNLPEIDGFEVTRRLRADDRTKSLAIIALTAHAMLGDREKTILAGCDDYAAKPIDFKHLLTQIETLSHKVSV